MICDADQTTAEDMKRLKMTEAPNNGSTSGDEAVIVRAAAIRAAAIREVPKPESVEGVAGSSASEQ